MNKSSLLAIAMIASLSLYSCTKVSTPSTIPCIEFGFTFDSAQGQTMTKANADVFDEFYSEIKNGNLVSDSFSLVLEHSDGTTYNVTGKWGAPTSITIKNGVYRVVGTSTADGKNVQANCSLKFDEKLNTADLTGNHYDLSADYDCSLLVFCNDSLSKVRSYNGHEYVELPILKGKYHYAFVHDSLWDDGEKDNAVIEFSYLDGTVSTVSSSSINLESGKYFVFDESNAIFNGGFGFDVPEMGDGGTTTPTADITIAATAGNVKNLLASHNCADIKSLKITGHIDASDFRFIKWNCLNLENIDLSEVTIDAYYGAEGTNEGYDETYPANEIPMGAFFYWMCHTEGGEFVNNDTRFYDEGMPSLKTVKLPVGITAIRRNAFARAYNLTEINIPEGVEIVDYVSFRYCTSLEEIVLPSTTKEIGLWTFTAMPKLKTVHCKATTPPTTNQSFGTLYDSDSRGWVDNSSYNTDTKFDTLYVPKGCKEAYNSWLTYFEKIVEE